MSGSGKKTTMDKMLSVMVAIGVIVFGFPCATLTVAFLLSDTAREADRALRSVAPVTVTVMAYTFDAVIVLAVLALAGWLALRIASGWIHRHHIYPDARGQLPIIRQERDKVFVDLVGKEVRALMALQAVGASIGKMPSAATMGRVFREGLHGGNSDTQEAPLPTVETISPVPFSPDMVSAGGSTANHALIVGATGSGKTVASFSMLQAFVDRQPNANVLIYEPGGTEWKDAATVTTPQGLFDVVDDVHTEMRRRQRLVASDPSAVTAADLGLPPIVLFIEEAGGAMDALMQRPDGRDVAKTFRLNLRDLFREGRKMGVTIFLVSQSAMAETFDTQTLDNIPNVILMTKGASKALIRRWGLTSRWRELKEHGVALDAPGVALDYHRDALVRFPKVERPRLKAGKRRQTSSSVEMKSDFAGDEPVTSSPPDKHPLKNTRIPTPQQARAMRIHYRNGMSKNELAMLYFGYKNGDVYKIINDTLEGKYG